LLAFLLHDIWRSASKKHKCITMRRVLALTYIHTVTINTYILLETDNQLHTKMVRKQHLTKFYIQNEVLLINGFNSNKNKTIKEQSNSSSDQSKNNQNGYLSQTQKLQNLPWFWVHSVDTEIIIKFPLIKTTITRKPTRNN